MELTRIASRATPGAAWMRALAFVRLARVDRAAVAAGYTLLGAYLADIALPDLSAATRAAVVVLLTVCFGFVLNDYRDVETDASAKPYRPLPSGAVSRRQAGALALALLVCALAVAATLPPLPLAIAAGAAALTAAYSFGLKGTLLLGNLAMGVLVAVTVVFGALAAGAVSVAVVALSAVMFLFAVAQEVLFNLRDEQGDRLAGVRTTASRLGARAALLLYRGLLALVVVVTLAAGVLGGASPAYAYAAAACIVAPLIAILCLLTGRITDTRLRRAEWITRGTWVSGILPMAMLGA